MAIAMIAERSAASAARTSARAGEPDGITPPCHTAPRGKRADSSGPETCQTLLMTTLPALRSAGHAETGLHEPCVLLKLGEIVLKGRNRQQFERLLQNNIRQAAADLGAGLRLWQRDGVIVLSPTSLRPGLSAMAAADHIAERMLTVMGVVRVCRASRVAKDPQAAIEAAADLAKDKVGSFAVRAKRRDKRFALTSAELAVAIGSRVRQLYGNPVNLSHPDFSIYLEVDQS